MKNTLQFATN